MKDKILTEISKDHPSKFDIGNPKKKPFIVLVFLFFIVLISYIAPLWEIVEKEVCFFLVLLILLFFSFVFSLTEAAYARIDSDNRVKFVTFFSDVQKEIAEKSKKEIESMLSPKTAKESKSQMRVKSKWNKYIHKNNKLKIFILKENNKRIVGSLAAISVFLNAAVAVFLPWTFFKSRSIPELNLVFTNVDISNKEWFVFFIATIPILFIGKVLPKYLGLLYPICIIMKFYKVARFANFTFGWLVNATLYVPQLIISIKRLSKVK